jgi:hypothetical protein
MKKIKKPYGYVGGGNYYVRGYLHDVGKIGETSYKTTDGMTHSGFDVYFRADNPKEFAIAFDQMLNRALFGTKNRVYGWVNGGNYHKRGYLTDVGRDDGEPWFHTEDGLNHSAYDVTFRPDNPKDYDITYTAFYRRWKRAKTQKENAMATKTGKTTKVTEPIGSARKTGPTAKMTEPSLSEMYKQGLATIQYANKRLFKAIKDEATETIQGIEPQVRKQAQSVLRKGADLFDRLSEKAAPKK